MTTLLFTLVVCSLTLVNCNSPCDDSTVEPCKYGYVRDGRGCKLNCDPEKTTIGRDKTCCQFKLSKDKKSCTCPKYSSTVNGECKCSHGMLLDTTLPDAFKCACPADKVFMDGKCSCPFGLDLDGNCVCSVQGSFYDPSLSRCKCNATTLPLGVKCYTKLTDGTLTEGGSLCSTTLLLSCLQGALGTFEGGKFICTSAPPPVGVNECWSCSSPSQCERDGVLCVPGSSSGSLDLKLWNSCGGGSNELYVTGKLFCNCPLTSSLVGGVCLCTSPQVLGELSGQFSCVTSQPVPYVCQPQALCSGTGPFTCRGGSVEQADGNSLTCTCPSGSVLNANLCVCSGSLVLGLDSDGKQACVPPPLPVQVEKFSCVYEAPLTGDVIPFDLTGPSTQGSCVKVGQSFTCLAVSGSIISGYLLLIDFPDSGVLSDTLYLYC
jgi:hypothetical protein